MTRWAWMLLVVIGCSGEGDKGDTGATDTDADADADADADSDTDTDVDVDITGSWQGSCDPFGTTSGTATITSLQLDLTDTDGAITGTWYSTANVGTTTGSTTTETYPVSGTRTGSDVALDVDTGSFAVTLDGTVSGDSMSLTLAIDPGTTTYGPVSSACTLSR